MHAYICRECASVIDPSSFMEDGRFDGRSPLFDLREALDSGYCFECYCEKALGETPCVVGPSVPARGTNLTNRQKHGQRKTDGG